MSRLNVQVIADPIGRLVWISPVMPGARRDMGGACQHGITDAHNTAEIACPPLVPAMP